MRILYLHIYRIILRQIWINNKTLWAAIERRDTFFFMFIFPLFGLLFIKLLTHFTFSRSNSLICVVGGFLYFSNIHPYFSTTIEMRVICLLMAISCVRFFSLFFCIAINRSSSTEKKTNNDKQNHVRFVFIISNDIFDDYMNTWCKC